MIKKSVHLVGYSHVKYTHSAQISRSQDDWASPRHKRSVACDTVFMRSNVARHLDDSHLKARTEGPEHESVPGVSGRSNGLARSERGWGLAQGKFSCARTTHFHSLSADLSVYRREETVKAAQTIQRTGREREHAILPTDNTRCN